MKLKSFIHQLAILSLISSILVLSSCEKEDDSDDQQHSTVKPIELSCTDINDEMILEDRSEGVDYYSPCMIQVNAGLIIDPGATIEFAQDASNTITANKNYPLHIAANVVTQLDGEASTYTGNMNGSGNSMDEIYVFSNSIYERGYITGQSAHVWKILVSPSMLTSWFT